MDAATRRDFFNIGRTRYLSPKRIKMARPAGERVSGTVGMRLGNAAIVSSRRHGMVNGSLSKGQSADKALGRVIRRFRNLVCEW